MADMSELQPICSNGPRSGEYGIFVVQPPNKWFRFDTIGDAIAWELEHGTSRAADIVLEMPGDGTCKTTTA